MINFKNVHHLREVLVTDAQGKPASMMQYSTASISRFRPNFVDIPFNDQKVAHELYIRLGGKRRAGMKIGMQVILELDEMSRLPA